MTRECEPPVGTRIAAGASPLVLLTKSSESHQHCHGHLTNNIHLRNLYHMHKQRVLMETRNSSSDLPLKKELTLLRRARSLRDPSTSPAWSNSSYGGSRRMQHGIGAALKREDGVKSDAHTRKDGRRVNGRGDSVTKKREKLDLRPGGQHWVGEFLGGEEATPDLQGIGVGSDQKENRVLRGNAAAAAGMVSREGVELEGSKSSKGSSNSNGKKNSSRRLEKSRSYPRAINPDGEDGEEKVQNPQKRSGSSAEQQHSELETMDGSATSVDLERLKRGSIRALENGWVEDPEKRAETARRVISEAARGGVGDNGLLLRGGSEGGGNVDTRYCSPLFVPKVSGTGGGGSAPGAHSRLEHLELLSRMTTPSGAGSKAGAGGSRDAPDDFNESGEEGVAEEEEEGVAEEEEDEVVEGEDEVSLRNAMMKQFPSSMSSHTHSPLLYRDSMTTGSSERSTPGRRRVGGSKVSGLKGDGLERKHRGSINVRVGASKNHRRFKGKRSNLRSGLAAGSTTSSRRAPTSFDGGGGMDGELEVSELPRNGCGIPWYWSRVQPKYRGRKLLDSLACGITTEAPLRSKKKLESSSNNNINNSSSNNAKLDSSSKQCSSSNSTHNRDFVVNSELHLPTLSLGRSSRYGERSSDFDQPSRHFDETNEDEEEEEEEEEEEDEDEEDEDACDDIPQAGGISRADGNLLATDRSGELVFGSTRDHLSGILIPSSPPFGGDEFPPSGHPLPLPLPLPPSLPLSVLETAVEEPSRSLSQKYRPKSFTDLVGQSLVTKSLNAAVVRGKIAPVYLFQGPRGTGKSSAARIFARALNCVSSDPDRARPCGGCSECLNSSPDVRELDAASDVGLESVKSLLASMQVAPSSSRCRVFIIDDCHCLSAEAWSAFLKALEKTPWHVVFVLITTDADKLPRAAIARCQKFLFSKVKEVEIVHRLQSLATQEGLEAENSALSLVASRSQGSLQDAETVLDQLSLLGKKISLSLVQEMVGLVSDDKLIELLDLAMSAEAVSTVRCMRELLDGGIEPLGLVSQLATLITDILAGTFIVPREKLMKGFFFRRSSKKEEAVRLRQALKILSEAEKQLRMSSDQPTWLTAALLQFAPDRSFQPSSLETSVMASPIAGFHDMSEEQIVFQSEFPRSGKGGGLSSLREHHNQQVKLQQQQQQASMMSSGFSEKRKKNGTIGYSVAKVHPAESPAICELDSPEERGSGRPSNARSDTPLLPGNIDDLSQRDFTVMGQRKLEEVWQRVLHGSRSNVLRQLLQGHGKLLSLLLSDAFAVAHVEFQQPEHKSRAERSRSRICNAFQMALGCPVELQITLACMPTDQLHPDAVYDDHPTIPLVLDAWPHKEKAKTPDRRSHESKSSTQTRRRHRARSQRLPAEPVDTSQSLYNAVLGDSQSFRPEILPAAAASSSTRWGKQGAHPGGGSSTTHEEDRSDMSREPPRMFSAVLPQELRHMESTSRARYGSSATMSNRSTPGKMPLKSAIHQYDDNVVAASPHPQDLHAEVMCGSGARRKSVKFKDVNVGAGRSPSLEQETMRMEGRLKPHPVESRLLCWRMQRIDEEKIKVRRRRRHRREQSLPHDRHFNDPTGVSVKLKDVSEVEEVCFPGTSGRCGGRLERKVSASRGDSSKKHPQHFDSHLKDYIQFHIPETHFFPPRLPTETEQPWNFHYNDYYSERPRSDD